MCPIYLGGIPACLASSLADPNLFETDLSDNNLDGTVLAYLYWCKLPHDQQPPLTLMFCHFNAFIDQELQILHQQEAHLCHWHKCFLGTNDHFRRCTLEWVAQQFARETPNPNITIDSITGAEHDHFNHLLNWAHTVYTT